MNRNRFIQLDGGTRPVNRELEEKARTLAGIKGYVTNLAACPHSTLVTADFAIGAHNRLFEIERSFRVAKCDLQARPVYHHLRDSIEAHLTIVFAGPNGCARIWPNSGDRPQLASAVECTRQRAADRPGAQTPPSAGTTGLSPSICAWPEED